MNASLAGLVMLACIAALAVGATFAAVRDLVSTDRPTSRVPGPGIVIDQQQPQPHPRPQVPPAPVR